jgi:uncharacterized protein YlxW (UPF0749 family)
MTLTSISERRGFTFPVWFLGAATAAFLSVSVVIGGVGLTTWSVANASATKNLEQDERLDALEQSRIEMAEMRADIRATRDATKAINDTLNRLIERELGRSR